MYQYDETRPIFPEEFLLPFAGSLDPENEWCKLAQMIPWATIEKHYVKKLGKIDQGRRAFSVRLAFGSLLIATKKKRTDQQTVQEISENPYLQYFVGFHSYMVKKPFNPSLMSYFRKRIDGEMVNEMDEIIALEAIRKQEEQRIREEKEKEKEKEEQARQENDHDDGDGGGPSIEQTTLNFDKPEESDQTDNAHEETENNGVLILDATCVPVDITYPTDVKLLNGARLITEEVIDVLYENLKERRRLPETISFETLEGLEQSTSILKKPRTYRNRARRDFLRFEKNRKRSYKVRRQAIKHQLGYVSRNLRTIETMVSEVSLKCLPERLYKRLLVAQEVCRQQQEMYRNRVSRVDDRIVSISQPWIRPIVRGKTSAGTEFGPKLAISVVDGYSFVEVLSFNSFNEGTTLKLSAERYKEKFGFFPKAIAADGIYRNRENRRFCKENGIRLSGKPLGRPSTDPEVLKKQKEEEKSDAGIRNAVEGVFGTAKRKLSLDRIMTRLPETTETSVSMHLVVLNLERMLRILLRKFGFTRFSVAVPFSALPKVQLFYLTS